MSHTWSEDWPNRIRSIVQGLGYEDVYEFVMSQPTKSFGELFRTIKDSPSNAAASVAFIQLKESFYMDAERRGCLRDALMETLVRSLRAFNRAGWNRGKKARERRSQALINWPVPSRDIKRWHEMEDKIWGELGSIGPADDWCPESRHDPVIQEAFARVWPAGAPPFLPTNGG